jgi:phosphoribosylglycinamide formyltransferase-1
MIQAFKNRIINIHPALLPNYGGKGMYGMKVHEAVKAAGEKETGITIHLVNEKYDEGRLLLQKSVELAGNETPIEISKKVQILEHHFFPLMIERWITEDYLGVV